MAYEPTMEDIIGILEQTEEGRRLIAKFFPPAPAVAAGSSGSGFDVRSGEPFVTDPEYYPLTGGQKFDSPAAAYMAESRAERENNIPPLITNAAPAGSHKRRPTTDEKIAAGDPYPDGFWRRMFPKAEIEYTYPGDDNYFEDRDQNEMLKQLIKNSR